MSERSYLLDKLLPAGVRRWNIWQRDDGLYCVNQQGIYQPDSDRLTVVVVGWTAYHIAIKVPGYTSNPGSRYSGLRSHSPTTIDVYKVLERDGWTLAVEWLMDWEASKPQTKVRVPGHALKREPPR